MLIEASGVAGSPFFSPPCVCASSVLKTTVSDNINYSLGKCLQTLHMAVCERVITARVRVRVFTIQLGGGGRVLHHLPFGLCHLESLAVPHIIHTLHKEATYLSVHCHHCQST